MKKLFAILFLFPSLIYSQVGTLNLIPMPHSPDVAALGKFVEVPVGYYSGIPQIGVPLCQLDVRGLSIPVSLSYNSSGIKPKDIPGSVGAGWALNAGGIITRITRGSPDDHEYSIDTDVLDKKDSLLRRRIRTAFTNMTFNSEFTLDERYDMCLSTPGVDADIEVAARPDHLYERKDTEIDLFYFNFMGHTGQFTFTNEGLPMLLTNSDLKIEYLRHRFKVTDAQGVQYFFDSTSKASDGARVVGATHGGMYSMSWYLSKIYMPHKNETVNFSYRKFKNFEIYDENMYANYAYCFYNRNDLYRYGHSYITNAESISPYQNCLAYKVEFSSTAPFSVSEDLFIDEINWNGNKIKFYGNTNRTDLFKYKLDSIRVSSGSLVIQRINFGYSYFNGSSSEPNVKKLRLDTITVNDQVYKFNYINSFHGKTLPATNAKGVDIWGYYNGEDEEGAIPDYKFLYEGVVEPEALTYAVRTESAARNSDYKYAQIGTLKSITYPTGGTTTFDYEGNDYSSASFYAGSIEDDPNTQLKFDSTLVRISNISSKPQSDGDQAAAVHELIIHKDQTAYIEVKLGQYGFDNLDYYRDSAYFRLTQALLSIVRFNDSTGGYDVIKSFEVSPIDSVGLPSYGQYPLVMNKGMYQGSFSISLPEGRYLISQTIYGWHMFNDIKVQYDFPYKKNSSTYNAGGLRVKKIWFNSVPENNNSFVKYFDYAINNQSSGVLESPFANMSVYSRYGNDLNWLDDGARNYQELCMYLSISSEPLIPLGNAHGGVIGYGRVNERYEDSSSTSYYYTTGKDDISSADAFLQGYRTRVRISEDNSWKRGLLRQVDYYNSNMQLVKQNFTKYINHDSYAYDNSVSVVLDNVSLDLGDLPEQTFDGYTAEVSFIVKSNKYALKSQDSAVLYSQHGTVSEVTKYEYKTNGYPHAYPVKITRRNSKGEFEVTSMKYPQDYPVGENPSNPVAQSIRNLLNRHILSAPVETVVQRTDASGNNIRTVGAQFVHYLPNLPVIDTVFVLETGSSGLTGYMPAAIDSVNDTKNSNLKPSLLFLSYDDYGNVTQQQKYQDVNEVILWGYNYAYPVASVKGASYSSVVAILNQSILQNPSSDQALRDELQKIRQNFPTAFVTTYTYKPLIGLTSQTDPNNRTTYYDYDAFGRLALIKDQDRNIVKRICYNYAGQPENCQSFSSVAKSGVFTRNCGTGTGSSVTYTVNAGAYTSVISQADADQKAQNDVNTNGQEYADSHGSCTFSSVAKSGVFTRSCTTGTGSSVTYTVNAGTYTSTISQTDADQKAQNDVNANGQNYANTHGTCTVTKYATLELGEAEPDFYVNCLDQYQDVIVRFYSDAAHTVPYNAANLPIQIKKGTTSHSNGQSGTTSYTTTNYSCNGTSFTLSQQLTYHGCASSCPEGFGCLPRPTDPYIVYSFSLVQSTFTITIP